jgi:formylglycine-generating enzyme required for sulfatase activity
LQKLNQKTGKKYRLPTEAEWEFAARGGVKSKNYKYAGTSNTSELYRYANFCDKNCTYSWAEKGQNDGYTNTSPVGSFLPNELGIYDMGGNVWEWCSDWKGDYSSSSQTNPTGSATGSYRVFRGGGWGNYPRGCRGAFRSGNTPTYRGSSLGFRVAISFQ